MQDHKKGHIYFASESVGEGHPDKLCDQVSDGVLDACFKINPNAKVAIETATKTGMVSCHSSKVYRLFCLAKLEYQKNKSTSSKWHAIFVSRLDTSLLKLVLTATTCKSSWISKLNLTKSLGQFTLTRTKMMLLLVTRVLCLDMLQMNGTKNSYTPILTGLLTKSVRKWQTNAIAMRYHGFDQIANLK